MDYDAVTAEITIDTRRLGDRLAKIQDSLPRGYKVTLLARNHDNPKGHVLLTDDREEDILRAITQELHAPDTKIQEPTRMTAEATEGERA